MFQQKQMFKLIAESSLNPFCDDESLHFKSRLLEFKSEGSSEFGLTT